VDRTLRAARESLRFTGGNLFLEPACCRFILVERMGRPCERLRRIFSKELFRYLGAYPPDDEISNLFISSFGTGSISRTARGKKWMSSTQTFFFDPRV
jgi:hypothetical protein